VNRCDKRFMGRYQGLGQKGRGHGQISIPPLSPPESGAATRRSAAGADVRSASGQRWRGHRDCVRPDGGPRTALAGRSRFGGRGAAPAPPPPPGDGPRAAGGRVTGYAGARLARCRGQVRPAAQRVRPVRMRPACGAAATRADRRHRGVHRPVRRRLRRGSGAGHGHRTTPGPPRPLRRPSRRPPRRSPPPSPRPQPR